MRTFILFLLMLVPISLTVCIADDLYTKINELQNAYLSRVLDLEDRVEKLEDIGAYEMTLEYEVQ